MRGALGMRFSRRAFLQSGLALAGPPLRAAAGELDRFGGWTKKRFAKTGYFRLDRDDRWWIVTPDGHGFLSFGVNHVHGGWWKAPYNGQHWARKFRLANPSHPRFNEALRLWLSELLPEVGFNSVGVHTDLALLNTPRPLMPYVAQFEPIEIPHWQAPGPGRFMDVFSDSFREHALRLAQRSAGPLRDDPMLLGYAMTDCPILTDWDARERGDVTA